MAARLSTADIRHEIRVSLRIVLIEVKGAFFTCDFPQKPSLSQSAVKPVAAFLFHDWNDDV